MQKHFDKLKEARFKKLYDPIYMILKKKQSYRNRNQITGCQLLGGKVTTKGHEGAFWDEGNIFYLGCGGGYMIT